MQTFDISLLPTAVDITLYRYNYIDNKLWAQIQNEVDFIQNIDGSIMVTSLQLEHVLENNYLSTINKIKTLGSDVIHKEINSTYFLYQMILEMDNLQYFKINLNFDKSYDRTVNVGDSKLLQFGFKVLTATLRLSDLFNEEELEIVNRILESAGVISSKKPYTRIKSKDLASLLDILLSAHSEDDEEYYDYGLLADIIDVLEPKLEPEDALLLLITDY